MKNPTIESSKQNFLIKYTRIIINLYLIVVAILGVYYLINSRDANMGIILKYLMGDTSLGSEAYIYTAVLELAFIIFAIFGSIITLILFKFKKVIVVLISTITQLCTIILYILCRIMLIQGIIHMSTKGEIKSTSFIDFKSMFPIYFESTKFVAFTIILAVGVILIPVLMNKHLKFYRST